jgi:hypothetical protein
MCSITQLPNRVILRKISSKDSMKDARKQYRLIFPLYINILTHKLHLHNINIHFVHLFTHRLLSRLRGNIFKQFFGSRITSDFPLPKKRLDVRVKDYSALQYFTIRVSASAMYGYRMGGNKLHHCSGTICNSHVPICGRKMLVDIDIDIDIDILFHPFLLHSNTWIRHLIHYKLSFHTYYQ